MNVAPIKSGLALRVTGMVCESSSITSFHLECVNPADWRSFHPGQYLVLRLAGVLRNYSLSGPQVPGLYRITVK